MWPHSKDTLCFQFNGYESIGHIKDKIQVSIDIPKGEKMTASRSFNAIMVGGDFAFLATTTISKPHSWKHCHIFIGTEIISMSGHTHLAFITLDAGLEHPNVVLINHAWCLLRGIYHLYGGPTVI